MNPALYVIAFRHAGKTTIIRKRCPREAARHPGRLWYGITTGKPMSRGYDPMWQAGHRIGWHEVPDDMRQRAHLELMI